MNDVVVMFLDGKEVLIENACFNVSYEFRSVRIYRINTTDIIAIFNFDNIVGVRDITKTITK